ncbi:Histidine--tRNA ligase (fragment) [groundwater metagenome]|uniref:Histidine--tRNA ligase n=1 Tax=groundwater metagenome TaxID=717931 RepID=A0A098ECB4_9ZZZZ
MQICGGGRYDNLIGLFSEDKGKDVQNKNVPAVGFAYGFDRVIEALKMQNLSPEFENRKILITFVSDEFKDYCVKVVKELRERNITADLDITDRKVRKAMEYANNKYKYVIIVGKKEVEENKVTLRDMESGEQKFLGVEEIKFE